MTHLFLYSSTGVRSKIALPVHLNRRRITDVDASMILLTTPTCREVEMAKYVFSRKDVESLAKRLDDRSWSPVFLDMPELRRDIRSASGLLNHFLKVGMPVTPIELDIFNGSV